MAKIQITKDDVKLIYAAMNYALQLCENEADQRSDEDTSENYDILAYRAADDLRDAMTMLAEIWNHQSPGDKIAA